MAQEAARTARKRRQRRSVVGRALTALCVAGAFAIGGHQALVHPDTPLPPEWNPTQALVISDPVTPLTQWKLNRAVADANICLATLEGFARLRPMVPLEENEQCYIRDRVDLGAVGQSRLAPVQTRCAIALRLAMWERHSLQPAAADLLGTAVASINHTGSYNCRTMRTAAGPSTRMSTHATADAIDISGFGFTDGSRLTLLADWDKAGAEGTFLRAARDGACKWFSLTLSPDYNSLHADHFHLQSRGWGMCR